jgi:hypothetical protein
LAARVDDDASVAEIVEDDAVCEDSRSLHSPERTS